MRLPALLSALALIAFAPAAGATSAVAPKHAAQPVVVELYTAQGCSDCPQANELLMKLADEPGVIALTFPVDYWDYLGWRDTYAKPEFAERQRAFQKAMKLRDVFTPQIVVDGVHQFSGVKATEVETAVSDARHARPAHDPAIEALPHGEFRVGAGTAPVGGATVWLVRYDRETRETEVTKGDNKGQKVRQGNLVRELKKLGPWKGQAHVYRLPKMPETGLRSVVLVQSARTGKILAARRF
jgi:hypothetical protein